MLEKFIEIEDFGDKKYIKYNDRKGRRLFIGDKVRFVYGTDLINHTGKFKYSWIFEKPVFTITYDKNKGVCASIELNNQKHYYPLTVLNISKCIKLTETELEKIEKAKPKKRRKY